MNDRYEVISAFLDDEPFDPRKLADAFSEPAGRDLLIDLLALRHLAQPGSKAAADAFDRRPTRSAFHPLVAAAALVLALAGGYFIGQRQDAGASDPPPATRVVEASAPWQDAPIGSMR